MAEAFYAKNRSSYLQLLAVKTLKSYADEKKKLESIKQYRQMTVLTSCFNKLKQYVVVRSKKAESTFLVETFYKGCLAQKVLLGFAKYTKQI